MIELAPRNVSYQLHSKPTIETLNEKEMFSYV